MRMWFLPPEWLCNHHLQGEHYEIHKAEGSIKKGRSLRGYIEKGQLDLSLLHERHNQLVREMLARGMNHQSELTIDNVPTLDSCVNVQRNLKDLMERCPNCRKRIEERKMHDQRSSH